MANDKLISRFSAKASVTAGIEMGAGDRAEHSDQHDEPCPRR